MKIKIPAQDLQLGMYVAALDIPWEETSFPFQGFLVKSESDLKLIHAGCDFVYIDVEKSSDPSSVSKIARSSIKIEKEKEKVGKRRFLPFWKKRTRSTSLQDTQRTPTVFVPLKEEIEPARELRRYARSHLYEMLQEARMGKIIDGRKGRTIVKSVLDSIVRNPNALMWVTQLRKRDEYTAMHSFNVCVLALGLGRHYGLGEAALLELGLGALMHDIGKIRVPLDILNKPEKLTDEEFNEMKKHTIYGREILSSASNISPSSIDISYTHHERMRGQGYSLGLRGDEISLFSKIVAIVDTYDAITSDRVYQKGSSPADALNILYHNRDKGYNQRLIELFIQSVGIYPIGTLVELSNQEVGIVVSSHPKARLAPQVLVVMDKSKRPFRPHRIIDLNLEEQRDGGIYIKQALQPGAYDIRVGDLVAESCW